MRAPLLIALVAALAVAVPGVAFAASASVVRGMVSYEAAPGEANSVTIVRTPDIVRIADAGATIAAGAGCESVSPNEVACSAAGVRGFDVALGDMDDALAVSSGTPVAARGGPGNDVLAGGEGGDRLVGGPGDDELKGGVGEDLFVGGAGADTFSGGSGSAEEFGLGPGGGFAAAIGVDACEIEIRGEFALDVVHYIDRSAPVRVTLDGRADDGEAGEGDNVLPDVEWVVGGRGADTLVGNDRQNFLVGWGGDDTLVGGGGPDLLLGARGDDRLTAGAGGDCANGGAGDDFLRGGAGRDLLVGGRGADRILGGAASDFLVSRDRTRDVVDGGAGFDFAFVDRRLDVVRRVERLVEPERRSEPPPEGVPLTGRVRLP